MKFLKKLFRIIYFVYAAIIFIVLMIPIFLWALIVIPFGKIKGANLLYRGCMLWGDIWFALIFIHHKNIYEQPVKKDQSYIFVSNHISYLDIPVIVKSIRTPVRPLGKAEISKVPVFGFIYKNIIVSVDRSSAENRAKSVELLISILRKGVSVLVFPEGTFNATHKPLKDFYDGAFRVAIETSTPIKPLLMLDTYDRMHPDSLFCFNPGKSRSVFLEDISTEGFTIADVKILKEKVYRLMEKKLIQYKASWIANEEMAKAD